jgi:uncharacterized protein with HEPN domain
MSPRGLSDLLADLDEAVDAAGELVGYGKFRWDLERPLRLAGEAVIGRIGDVASKLPGELIQETPEVPWDDVRGMRIVVDHVYHAVDYNIVWETLRDDVPKLGSAIERWRSMHPEVARGPSRDTGLDLGL